MKLKRWHIWLGLIISAIFLYFALRGVEFGEVWQVFKSAKFWWLIPGLTVYFLGVFIRTWRWKYLLKPLKKINLKVLFPIINIGYMGNNVYPARAGEFLRAIVLKRHEEVSISASLATIVVERIFDAIVIMGFVVLNLGQLASIQIKGNLSRVIQNLAIWGGVAFLILLGIFILVALLPAQSKKLLTWVTSKLVPRKWRKGFEGIGEKFLEGLSSLRSPLDILMMLVSTILIWTCETVLYWSVMQAMGLSLNFMTLMFINGVINLVLLIPAAPGGLGTFDAACKTMLEAYGVNSEIALGFTLVLRVVLWIPITLLGAIFFLREGLKWNLDIKELEEGNLPNSGSEA
ncbi:MAG: flippase-like domain-containing protein [Anaerolineaceae bacterium]|nr:flippase-like domain-containing protein [Anaerolineaceae bacterium]